MSRLYSAMWICLTAGLMAFSGQDKAPSIVIDNPVKDFGKVMQGTMLKHAFSFSNKGTTTLEILTVEASCGCQTASPSADKIPAGRSGQIEVSVDTAGMTGAIEESVSVATNDPRRPKVSLSVRADVQPEISLSSTSIYYERVPKGKEVTSEIIITVVAGGSIRILGAESSDKSVTVKLEPVPGSDGKRVKLIATHKGDGKIGYRLESIIVKTSSYLTPELSIYVAIRNFNR